MEKNVEIDEKFFINIIITFIIEKKLKEKIKLNSDIEMIKKIIDYHAKIDSLYKDQLAKKILYIL